ncbi:hypothetical protein CC78DRAFT_599264 [Lojkania enalia]|uniref:AA1-like domain-containing protein n=1 Tax=Lojkania enalia TaxID=147567 RepID=A0A9P4JWB5_9PLEO|nr:hypothetical protein CC78DRAFT_599264 [Didymosphaeria enalia]
MVRIALLSALPLLSYGQPWLPFDQSLPCLIKPSTTVAAGETLEFQLFNARNSTCDATLNFADSAYLPMVVTVKPRNCAGDQTASFSIPCNAPNGTAALQWQCAGQQATSCAILNITGGTGDYEKFQMERVDSAAYVHCWNNSVFISEPTGSSVDSGLYPVPTICFEGL